MSVILFTGVGYASSSDHRLPLAGGGYVQRVGWDISRGMGMSTAWGLCVGEWWYVQRGEWYVQGWVCLEVEACPGEIYRDEVCPGGGFV